MIVSAYAKLNLSLQVRGRDASGFHPIRSLVQSIAWSDTITLTPADSDQFQIDGDLEPEETNLAWRALEAIRNAADRPRPVDLHLHKELPVAAGLGGGSADAAATLIAGGLLFGVDRTALDTLAPPLGSDVPFCLSGGSAWMEGRGEVITPLRSPLTWAVAVVVPPFELSTAGVYRRWDELDGPGGMPLTARHLPPPLRPFAPLQNDLTPAAVDLRPEIGDWMNDLRVAWETPVIMTGSGPAVFGFFANPDEAREAVASVSASRAVWSGTPVDTGWKVVDRDPMAR